MELSRLKELHYIAHLDNLVSILEHGLVCHRDARLFNPVSVADPKVQSKRANKKIPQGLPLHQYVNLYINARNPMLFKICKQYSKETICVLCLDVALLHLPQVVIADGNAASDYTAFSASPQGLTKIREDLVFAESWKDTDQIQEWRKKNAIMAEVLVPHRLDSSYVRSIHVVSDRAKEQVSAMGIDISITVNNDLFFQDK